MIGAKKVCGFVSKEYGLSRFTDLSEKHIYAYVQYARENEICDSTISTDISGVYFFYRFSGGTNLLPKKEVFHFRKANVQPEDIRWTDDEIIDALLLAQLQKRKDIELAIRLSVENGMSLDEIVTLRVGGKLIVTDNIKCDVLKEKESILNWVHNNRAKFSSRKLRFSGIRRFKYEKSN